MGQSDDHPIRNFQNDEDSHFLSFLKANSLNLVLAVLMVALGGWMAVLIATSDGKSPREAAYQTMILTIASVIASLIITKIYAEQGHGQNLRDHGVQIAGGIIVLKGQIEVLADWIAAKRSQMIAASLHIPEVTDAVLEHIEQTLSGFRGMTDAALGGIAGVIGDALAQYESVMEQISRIRLEAFHQTREIEEKIQTAVSPAEITALQTKIQEIALKTERDIAQLARRSAIPIPEHPKRLAEEVPVGFSCPCPHCSKENGVQMSNRAGETKVTTCAHCGATFNVHVLAGGRVIGRALGQTTPVPAGKNAFQGTVLYCLRETQAYVEPSSLAIIIKRILSADAALRTPQNQPTPLGLQQAVCDSIESGDLGEIKRATVKIVFKMLFHGRAFKFPQGSPVSFHTPFVNTLKEHDLYEDFARSCLYRLHGQVDLRPESVDELAQIILPEEFTDRRASLERALASTPASAAIARTGIA
jgi:hypothetical protein